MVESLCTSREMTRLLRMMMMRKMTMMRMTRMTMMLRVCESFSRFVSY